MSLSSYKLTDAAIAQKGVVAAPDKLTGTAEQNKMIFDRLIRETVKALFNGLIDELTGEDGASDIGTNEIEGVTGADVQTVLGSMKTLVDTKLATADANAALALKSDKSVTDLHFKSVSFDAETGVFTFTKESGAYVTIDTVLEKVATNWQYNAETQSLVLTLADGTTQSVPLSAFITETEFTDSAQIAFSVSNHIVTATVKAGSITDTMLSSALVAQLQGYVSAAANSATNAAQSETAAELYRTQAATSASTATTKASEAAQSATAAAGSATTAATQASSATSSAVVATNKASDASDSATLAESYAKGGTGTREGENTDNAKYYKEQAAAIVGGDYTTRAELADKETATASKAYAIGEYFTMGNGFYKATAAIAQGDTIVVGTNCQSVKLANETAAHNRNGDIHVTAAQKNAWSGKQDALTFDQTPTANSGNPVTSGGVKSALDAKQNNLTFDNAPTANSDNPVKSGGIRNAIDSAKAEPFVYSFSANDWIAGNDGSTITIPAATHGITGTDIIAQFWHQVSGVYLFNTWGCIESWAEIDASTHIITLHFANSPGDSEAGYTGKVVIYG